MRPTLTILATILTLAGEPQPATTETSTTETASSSSTTASSGSEQATSDIVDTAVAAGSFGTLVAAAWTAGLEDTLRGDGPFTVFAPTDEAFAALPPGTVESLLRPENRDQLVAVLTYHVVAGDVRAAQVVGMTSAPTVQGQPIQIAVEGGSVRLNDSATVTTPDIACSNGVIHVIDRVILPPG